MECETQKEFYSQVTAQIFWSTTSSGHFLDTVKVVILGPSVLMSIWSSKWGIETWQKSWQIPCWSPPSRKNDEFMVKEVMSGKKRFWTWRSHFHRERYYGCAGRWNSLWMSHLWVLKRDVSPWKYPSVADWVGLYPIPRLNMPWRNFYWLVCFSLVFL